MKRSLICAIALLSATLSCKKDPPKPVNKFTGKWEMVLVTGGIAGIHMTPAQFGHTAGITFYHDSTVSVVRDGSLATGTYTTNIDSQNLYHKTLIKFRTDGSVYEYQFLHDTLTLYPYGLMDGFTEWYVRPEN